ncbi:MAG: hypothetical protein ACN4GM_11025 [Gammaproteobacteria bacterium]
MIIKDNLLSTIFILIIYGLILLPTYAFSEAWDFRDTSMSLGYGYEKRADNDIFVGQKVLLDAQYAFNSQQGEISEKLRCCARPSLPEYFYGLMDLQLRWGTDGTGLEYVNLNITPQATMWQSESDSTDKYRTKWDLFELGATRFITDDALDVDSYLEFSFLRAGRMGAFKWSSNSPFTLITGMQASTGWAWGKSNNDTYSDVSNPFAGLFFNIALEHKSWGKLYTEQRFVNGFSFSSPARGHPTAREAMVRLGYFKPIYNCLALDIYIEKRSFYFDEGNLPALYTETGTVVSKITCRW